MLLPRAEYPAGTVAAAENTEDPGAPKAHQQKLVILSTNTCVGISCQLEVVSVLTPSLSQIDLGFVVAKWVAVTPASQIPRKTDAPVLIASCLIYFYRSSRSSASNGSGDSPSAWVRCFRYSFCSFGSPWKSPSDTKRTP